MSMLEAALQYAGRGWKVFQLTGFKTPFRDTHGHLDATTDPVILTQWWTKKPWANIGLACGDLVVFDPDGPEGREEFAAMAKLLGGIPKTLVHSTGRPGNRHFIYRSPAGVHVKSHNGPRAIKGGPGLDIKAHGGYVVLPPSRSHKTNTVYSVELDHPIAELTPDMVTWIAARKGGRRISEPKVPMHPTWAPGPLPPHLAALGGDVAERAIAVDRETERPEFERCVMLLPNSTYDDWYEIGAAIHDFDPGPEGLALFKRWAFRGGVYGDERDEVDCEKKWNVEYKKDRTGKAVITKASVYGLAKEHLQNRRVAEIIQPVVAQQITQFRFAPLPPQRPWEDLDDDGNPRGTCMNASIAIQNLGISCRKDVFHEKMLLGGHAIERWAGDLSDDAVHMVRRLIRKAYLFEPGEKNVRDAAVQLCLENQFNPVTDYLDALTWDQRPRIGRWLTVYLGADDTPLNRETGRLVLVAAVRRAYEPGVKFDQIMVLEGRQGTGKSTALKILAGEDNFSDQHILGQRDREQQEAFTGVWIHEIAELAGMRRADIEAVKQFASRTEDRARPAYGRIRVDIKRKGIFVATTNQEIYLRDDSGNRRFWPVLTGSVDLEALRRDRDQLWAEAAEEEARGGSLFLDARLWAHAGAEQESRVEEDAWHDDVEKYVRKNGSSVSVVEVLTGAILLRTADIGQGEQTRCARILRRIGLERYRQREGESLSWRYRLRQK